MNTKLFKFYLYSLLRNQKKIEKYRKKIRCSYQEAINYFIRKKTLKLTELEKLAQSPFPFYTNELFYFNDFYGINYTLKKYIGLPQSYQFKCVIQHGVYYFPQSIDQEFQQNLPVLLTTSNYAKKILSPFAPQYEFFPISLNILYAEQLFSQEQFFTQKERLKKNLLFFPMHSAVWTDINFDAKYIISKLQQLKLELQLNSITVCMYWLDIPKKRHTPYLNNGFNVVTAGHMLDPFFLPRLKTILSLSDIVVSNHPGSYLFYALALNKPFYLLNDHSIITKNYWCSTTNEYYSENWLSKMNKNTETIELYKLFDTPSLCLSDKQIEFKNIHCAPQSFKSPIELKKLIDYCEEKYNNGNYKKFPDPHEIYI